MVRDMDVGDDVVIEYQRDGQVHRTTATLRRMEGGALFGLRGPGGDENWSFRLQPPVADAVPWSRTETWPDGGNAFITAFVSGVWADIELVGLNEQLGSYFGTTEGLLVINAPHEEGFDLRGGDVILSIDGREPRSPAAALRILRSYEAGEEMSLEIMRNRQRMTVKFEVPDSRGSGLLRERLRIR